MSKNLVIVESPAKSRTIEKFLGDGFIVRSSIGHIRDLPIKEMGVDIENDFKPVYKIAPDKKKIVSELKSLAKDASFVYLATDEDREGEAIAWHLFEALNLNAKKTSRIVYHEITKSAIQQALASPREIDKHLVDAQQARRVLDRLVGYELSPVLWKKIKPSLSAGRVQSVAVRLIVERENEITSFQPKSFFKVSAIFFVKDKSEKINSFKAEIPAKFENEKQAKEFLEKLIGAKFSVKNIEKKSLIRTPAAPFTTSTLQQEAGRKFGYSVSQTMRIAQSLYEAGRITYMRTDSVNLSTLALNDTKNEIQQTFGNAYWKKRQYSTKSANAQEAHEAIRPTSLSNRTIDSTDSREIKLYELIWKRTIASQMADAELEKTIITISQDKTQEEFIAAGEIILFDGFLKVYMESIDDEDEEQKEILPAVKIGQELEMDEVNAIQRFTAPPQRYNESMLVKKLESLDIGRPSTYAPTISTIVKRTYIVKESRAGKERRYLVFTLKEKKISSEKKKEIYDTQTKKLFPTDIGIVVNDFLEKNFPQIMDYKFTAKVEKEFDIIAEGKMSWTKMIKNFYEPFHENVKKTSDTSERARGERLLGKDTKTGKNIYAKIGRYGAIVQMGELPKKKEKIVDMNAKDRPRFAKLQNSQRIDTITIEEALGLFKLPRTVGDYENIPVMVSIGRFGPYIKYSAKNESTSGKKDIFVSLPKTDDPYSVNLERCIEILKQPRLPRSLGNYEGTEVTVNKGRFGPYIKFDNLFVSLKKDNPFAIELPRAIELIMEKKEKVKDAPAKKSEWKTKTKKWKKY
ncbi:MAG: type I DNA topoisomerase [Bacteroidota bacterium]